MKRTVYADNAATSPMDPQALDSMVQCIRDHYANPSQLYSSARQARELLESSRRTIADCIGAHPDEIFFTSGGSESNNWAVKGTYRPDSSRHTILASSIEHHSVLRAVQSMFVSGERAILVNPDHAGVVHPDSLRAALDGSVRLVSVMTANNEIGTIEPIAYLCRVAHDNGSLFHTDAVQAVGHIPVDVKELDVDMLSSSAHKFNGPRGFGFLYVRRGTDLRPLINGGGQQDGMRAGTEDLASVYAASIALKNNCDSMMRNAALLREFEDLFLDILADSAVDFIRNGSEDHIPGSVSVSFKGRDGEALLHRLDLMGYCISTGSACNSRDPELSHVIRAIGVDELYAEGTIRVTFGKYNTEEEVRGLAEALVRILSDRID